MVHHCQSLPRQLFKFPAHISSEPTSWSARLPIFFADYWVKGLFGRFSRTIKNLAELLPLGSKFFLGNFWLFKTHVTFIIMILLSDAWLINGNQRLCQPGSRLRKTTAENVLSGKSPWITSCIFSHGNFGLGPFTPKMHHHNVGTIYAQKMTHEWLSWTPI